MQTKKQSLTESIINVAVGYFISLLSLFIIFPIIGIESSPGKNIIITLYFTIISILRSYILRRYFNKKHAPIPKPKGTFPSGGLVFNGDEKPEVIVVSKRTTLCDRPDLTLRYENPKIKKRQPKTANR